MIKKFDEFNSKFKFLFGLKKDREVAESLNIRKETFITKKRRDDIPYEQVIKYCEEKNVDLNWILNIKEN
jgi:hypothetical protein